MQLIVGSAGRGAAGYDSLWSLMSLYTMTWPPGPNSYDGSEPFATSSLPPLPFVGIFVVTCPLYQRVAIV